MININAILKVRFKSERYNITINYNSFVKAPFDTYLITAAAKAAKNEDEVYQYIDDITGDGSLNSHFRKLYDEVKTFNKKQIDSILENSLFPIKEVDNSNSFLYYPEFNVSQLNGQFYSGNLKDNPEKLKETLVEEDGKTFVSMEIEKDEYSSDSNVLSLKNLNITNNSASFYLKGLSDPIVLSIDRLVAMTLDKLTIDLDDSWYEGTPVNSGSGDNWYILTDQAFDDFESYTNKYFDDENDLYLVYPSQIEKVEILQVKEGFYFYKKTSYSISKQNDIVCNKTLLYLVDSKKINEFKTSDILQYLKVCDSDIVVRTLQYLLPIKDSDQLATFALDLIKGGHIYNWNRDCLRKVKKVCQTSDYEMLYQLDNGLDWSARELLYVRDDLLLPSDYELKTNYLKDIKSYQQEIDLMLGHFSSLGIREDVKKLGNKDQLVKDFNKFLNQYVGHNKVNIDDINDIDELKKHYVKIKNVYDNQLPAIQKRLKELDNEGK